jgi:hypothetical protein
MKLQRKGGRLRLVIRWEGGCSCGMGCEYSEVGFLTAIMDWGRQELRELEVACVHVCGVM